MDKVYIVFKVNAESWNAGPPVVDSVHANLESAISVIPENILKLERSSNRDNVVKDYAYREIREYEVFNV